MLSIDSLFDPEGRDTDDSFKFLKNKKDAITYHNAIDFERDIYNVAG